MTIATVARLVDALRTYRLLSLAQEKYLDPSFLKSFSHPRALAKELVRLNYLTVYQVNQLFQGFGQDLVLGPYRILDRLGEGGISQVFKAWHLEQNCLVALKAVRQDLLTHADAARQFKQEIRALTRMGHPNVIRLIETNQIGKTQYFAMEYLEGIDLGKLVSLSGSLPVPQACGYVRQAALGLEHAHERCLVHRDIKPANLFLTQPAVEGADLGKTAPVDPPSVVKILDWGLARLLDQQERDDGVTEEELLGTADYLAPEQAVSAGAVDIRADIYSLGCTFYYLLTGRPPFPGKNILLKLKQHQDEEPEAVQRLRPEIPTTVANIVHKMIAKRPEDRYRTPAMVAVALAPHAL